MIVEEKHKANGTLMRDLNRNLYAKLTMHEKAKARVCKKKVSRIKCVVQYFALFFFSYI